MDYQDIEERRIPRKMRRLNKRRKKTLRDHRTGCYGK